MIGKIVIPSAKEGNADPSLFCRRKTEGAVILCPVMTMILGGIEDCELRESLVGSVDYRKLRGLRFAELRKPLGLDWTEAEGKADQLDRHFGLYLNGELVGTVVISALKSGLSKLRQIAVAHSHQGRGLGRILMAGIESLLAMEGAKGFELHARLEVAGFYDALDYVREGDLFEEIGLPHVKMVKLLKESGSV